MYIQLENAIQESIKFLKKVEERKILGLDNIFEERDAVRLVKARDKNKKENKVRENDLFCPKCDISFEESEPQNFSFNSPLGACDKCSGLGTNMKIDPDLLIQDASKSLVQGCLLPAGEQPQNNKIGKYIRLLKEKYDFLYTTPWKQLPDDFKKELLFGFYKGRYIGVVNDLEKRYKTTHSSYIREWIERFMNTQNCSQCKGARLKQESLSVFIVI